LLAHGRERLVSDEELMINVWEKNNLRPSAQLMAGYPDPKISLKPGGVESTLIVRVKCAGYYINACVAEIYSFKPPGMMNYINNSPADMNKLLVRN
jgi:DNA-binding winged helix-turn-helix (wHTH) protein